MKKRIRIILISMCLLLTFFALNIFATQDEVKKEDPLNLTSRSAILMEPITGEIIFEKNAHEPLRPASVTKNHDLIIDL